MPRYRVLETSYIGDKIVNPGDEIEYSGRPGSSLQPLDAGGRKKAGKSEAGASDDAAGTAGGESTGE